MITFHYGHGTQFRHLHSFDVPAQVTQDRTTPGTSDYYNCSVVIRLSKSHSHSSEPNTFLTLSYKRQSILTMSNFSPGQRQVFRHQPGQSPWGFLLKSWVFLRNQKLVISQNSHPEVFTQVMSFPQNPEIGHRPGQSHWGFYSSHKFPQRPDFRHQPSRDRDKLY